MRLPRSPIWVILGTVAWLSAFPVAAGVTVFIGDMEQQTSYFGWQASLMLALLFTLLVAGIVLPVTVIATEDYNRSARLTAWRPDRLRASILATAILLPLSLALLVLAVLASTGSEGRLIGIWMAGWVAWALVIRALFVDRPGRKPPQVRSSRHASPYE